METEALESLSTDLFEQQDMMEILDGLTDLYSERSPEKVVDFLVPHVVDSTMEEMTAEQRKEVKTARMETL